VYGSGNPVGTVDVWRRVVDLLPRGELQLAEGGRHAPWLDAPGRLGGQVSRFLAHPYRNAGRVREVRWQTVTSS
jgi:hypothetical protein